MVYVETLIDFLAYHWEKLCGQISFFFNITVLYLQQSEFIFSVLIRLHKDAEYDMIWKEINGMGDIFHVID